LQPENDTMEAIIIKPNENNVRIIGKIKGVIRKI
jgi:SOS-response transcriptional repressor LexA